MVFYCYILQIIGRMKCNNLCACIVCFDSNELWGFQRIVWLSIEVNGFKLGADNKNA